MSGLAVTPLDTDVVWLQHPSELQKRTGPCGQG